MTAIAFLDALRERGVVLSLDPAAPNGLRYRAPRGVVTATVADRIRRTAPMLLPLLTNAETAPNPAMPPEAPRIAIEAPMARLGTHVLPSPSLTADLGIDPIDDARETIAFLRPKFASLDWSKIHLTAPIRLPSGRWVGAVAVAEFADSAESLTRAGATGSDDEVLDLAPAWDEPAALVEQLLSWCQFAEARGVPAALMTGYLIDVGDLSALWQALHPVSLVHPGTSRLGLLYAIQPVPER